MVDSFYQDMQDIASELITEFKQGTIQYVDVAPGTGPADEPGSGETTTLTIDAVARSVQFKYINNTDIVQSDSQITLSGAIISSLDVLWDGSTLWDNLTGWSTDTLDIRGWFTIDGAKAKIIKVKRVPQAGTPVAFIVIVRT
jgi:hypothetical protein